MELEPFCIAVHKLGFSQTVIAICLLWYFDDQEPGASKTPGQLARMMRDNGLGMPHVTRLEQEVLLSRKVQRCLNKKLKIKPTARDGVRDWLTSILEKPKPTANHDIGFLPQAVWRGTKSYLEKIAEQVNGCFEFEFYDGSAVMCRKLVENLLIESFEHLGIEGKIKLASGDYMMLKDILNVAINGGLKLGRDSKRVLPMIKELGDRSAHTPRYTAKKPDLIKIESGLRLVIEELIELAGLKKKT